MVREKLHRKGLMANAADYEAALTSSIEKLDAGAQGVARTALARTISAMAQDGHRIPDELSKAIALAPGAGDIHKDFYPCKQLPYFCSV